MNEKEFIERLKRENTDFPNERMARNLANSLESLSSDIFTEYIRFLFELIQNADDAEASEVAIYLQNNYLIVSHSGKSFDQKDVEAICSIGEGTKKAEGNKTGYKGIGFKSVFGKSNNVSIFSKGFQFRFENTFKHQKFSGIKMPWQIIPQWTELSDLPSSASTFLKSNKFNVSTFIQLKETTSLEKDMIELLNSGEVLLFLRSVSKISISGNLKLSIEKKETKTNTTYKEINLQKNDISISSWIVYSFEGIPIEDSVRAELQNDEKTPIKLQNAKVAEISFAAKIEKGKLKPLSGNESLVFTFLPTKVTSFQFPFLINSSFLTSANREEIHDDRVWNQWLMNTAAKRLLDWLSLLATTKEFSLQILHLLPQRTNLGNKLINEFFTSFFNYALTKEFIPNKNSKLKKAPDILIDKTGLSNESFIPTEVLIEFVNTKKENKFKNDSFIHPKLEAKKKLDELNSTTFDLDNLEEFFSNEIFKSNHQPEQNFSLIKYFYEKANSEINSNWSEKLQFISFIYAKGKTLRPPRFICFPSKGDLTVLENEIKIIHTDVYNDLLKNTNILDWLRKLGVTEVSEIKWLENEILPNLDNLNYTKEYLSITQSIFHLHKQSLLEDWHYSRLCDFKLLCKDKGFKNAKECYFSDFYLPELALEKVYSFGNYISDSYCTKGGMNKTDLKSFFISLQVNENISLKRHQTDLFWGSSGDSDYRNFIDGNYNDGSSNWSYHTGGFSKSHAFRNFIEFSMMSYSALSYPFSKLFWNNVLTNYSEEANIFNDITLLHGWSRDYHTYVKNYIKWFIEEKKCIPTSQKNLQPSKDVFINHEETRFICSHYLPTFDYDKPISPEWLNVFHFKKELELKEYLTILAKIAEETEEDEEFKKSNKKRIGLIYEKIANQINNYSEEEKKEIRIWATQHKLLSSSEKFENANELKWIKISGFTTSSERLKLLFNHENTNTNSKNFEKLLSLLGITIIDKFELSEDTLQSAVSNSTLKNQLQNILPFLTLIIEKKHLVNCHEEHKRLVKVIEEAQFFSAPEIILSFNNKGEKLQASSLQAYLEKENLKVFFKGKWTSPVTLFALVPELSALLSLNGLNDELKLFLQLTPNEIVDWLTENNIDFSNAPEVIISETQSTNNTESISPTIVTSEITQLNQLLSSKNISFEQLIQLIERYDADEDESKISISSNNHLEQKGKNEENETARKLVVERLRKEGFEFKEGIGNHSVVNGVWKNGIEYPLVVKSYRNTSYKFNIRPNEWLQLSKPNSMFWVHRGNGVLEVLNLEGLLRANSEFHVQFETSAFSFEGLVKFAEVFRFVKNVHFQLDAPNFSIAKAFEEYGFDKRKTDLKEVGGDIQELLH
jgi:hypothetical protein